MRIGSLRLSLILLAACAAVLPVIGSKHWPAAALSRLPSVAAIGSQERPAMLESTVVITFLIPESGAGDSKPARAANGNQLTYFRGSSGLGTMIETGHEKLILTHDHWRDFYHRHLIVEVADSSGHVLQQVSGAMWRTLVRYNDGGVMLLAPPPGLQASNAVISAARAGQGAVFPEGAIVHVTGRRGQRLSSEKMIVVDGGDGSGSLKLSSPSGFVVRPGNSGAGIWYQGRVVANMTSTVVTGAGHETARSEASLLPAAALAGSESGLAGPGSEGH